MRLSIIVPVYNAEKWIKKCLESIRQQSIEDYEVIMVNDGSADSSGAICEEYQQIDPRFRLINIENSGPAHARNVGIQQAQGDYIGFIDSDDYIEVNMYGCLLEYIHKCQADIAVCGLKYVDELGRCIKVQDMQIPFEHRLGKEEIKEFLIKKYYENDSYGVPTLCNKIYRKQFIQENKLIIDEERVRAEDYWFNLYAYCCADAVVAVNGKFYNYVQHSDLHVMSAFRENQFELFVKTRKELLKLNEKFQFAINYNDFDAGFLQETASYILQMLKINGGEYNSVKRIFTNEHYRDAIFKCHNSSKQIRLINWFLKKRYYWIAYMLYQLWGHMK